MLKLSLAEIHKKYSGTCVLVGKFCVQLRDNRPDQWSINQQLSIGLRNASHRHVGKSGYKALMLSTFTHSQSPAFFRLPTDTLSYLSTLSTSPITTTTNIFNKK
jgi:hypothetical protein